MEWLNLRTAFLRSAEFIGSTPVERGTWLCVLGWSVEQENGGRIVGGAGWKDRQWQQACGVTLREVRAATKLLEIDGADVVVRGYPLAQQAECERLRSTAKLGAEARWGKQRGMPEGNATPMPQGIAKAMPQGNAKGKDKEREGKREGESAPPPSSSGGKPEPTGHERLARKLKACGMDAKTPALVEEWALWLSGTCAIQNAEEGLWLVGWFAQQGIDRSDPIRYVSQAAPVVALAIHALEHRRRQLANVATTQESAKESA